MNEDDGSVSVAVEILRGTPARDVTVTLKTTSSSARGEALINQQAFNASVVASFPTSSPPVSLLVCSWLLPVCCTSL